MYVAPGAGGSEETILTQISREADTPDSCPGNEHLLEKTRCPQLCLLSLMLVACLPIDVDTLHEGSCFLLVTNPVCSREEGPAGYVGDSVTVCSFIS